jgi:hypothetical protein
MERMAKSSSLVTGGVEVVKLEKVVPVVFPLTALMLVTEELLVLLLVVPFAVLFEVGAARVRHSLR